MRKLVPKDIGYYRTILIIIVAFSIIGNYLYVNDSHLYTDLFFYAGGSPDHPVTGYEQNFGPYTLEGGHKYTFFVYMSGETSTELTLEFTFDTLNNFTYTQSSGAENTILGVWGTTSKFLRPFSVEEDENVSISGQVVCGLPQRSRTEWYVQIYQDLPPFLVNKILLICIFDAIVLVIWFFAYEQYERIFVELEQKKREKAENQVQITSSEQIE